MNNFLLIEDIFNRVFNSNNNELNGKFKRLDEILNLVYCKDSNALSVNITGLDNINQINSIGSISCIDNISNYTEIQQQNIWYKININTIFNKQSIDFIMPDKQQLKYIGNIIFNSIAMLSFSAKNYDNDISTSYEFSLFKNSALIPNYITQIELTDKLQNIILLVPIDAINNDYFELYVRNTENTNDIIIQSLQFIIK